MDPNAAQSVPPIPPPSVPPTMPETPAVSPTPQSSPVEPAQSQPVATPTMTDPVVAPQPVMPAAPVADVSNPAPVVSQPVSQPVSYTPVANGKSSGSKMLVILVGFILAVAIVGGGTYLYMTTAKAPQKPAAQQSITSVTQPPQPTLTVDQQIDKGVGTLDSQVTTIDSAVQSSAQGLSDNPVDLSN